MLKQLLEAELGKITEAELDFAIQHVTRNQEQIKKVYKSDAKFLDELSSSIQFYRDNLERRRV